MLKGLDAALVPVGGTYTLDAKEEKALMDEIKPRLIIPMHYRRDHYGFGNIATIKEFTDLYDSAVYSDDCSVDITNEGPEGVLVLKHIGQK
jgi:L-ascorbate metabolism protein UlaG (beta-lactamase superfamily)